MKRWLVPFVVISGLVYGLVYGLELVLGNPLEPLFKALAWAIAAMVIGDYLGPVLFAWPKNFANLLDYVTGEVFHPLAMAVMIGVLQAWMASHYSWLKAVYWMGPVPFMLYYLPRKLYQVDDLRSRIERRKGKKYHSILTPPES